jgi:hypothetical protein
VQVLSVVAAMGAVLIWTGVKDDELEKKEEAACMRHNDIRVHVNRLIDFMETQHPDTKGQLDRINLTDCEKAF